MSWVAWAAAERDRLAGLDRWRELRPVEGRLPWLRAADGRELTCFAGNDYLGLASHPAVGRAAAEAALGAGTGAGASRLVVGTTSAHEELERALARWRGAERALVFPSGYAANVGVVTTFGVEGVTIFSDERNHASIVDGCRLARAEVVRYPHLDLDQLAQGLRRSPRAVVVTDSVFSMDGDVAPVDELARLCGEHGALLVLDEAHAVLGPEPRLGATECLRVGTLSKHLGSLGGFVAGPAELVELVANRARTFVYTTALNLPAVAAAREALRVLEGPEGETRVARLRAHVERVRPGHPSPIVPVVLGDDARALAASEALLRRGLLVPAIRPPTVPEGGARLRITLSCLHSEDDVDGLLDALDALGLVVPAADPVARRGGTSGRHRSAAPAPSWRAGVPDPGSVGDGGPTVVVVTGTGTDVGKTHVAAATLRALAARGLVVAARKPFQSFSPGSGPTDAEVLAAASGEDPETVCPPDSSFPVPLAPPMAAEALGQALPDTQEVAARLRAGAPATGVVLVEGAGGLASPLTADGDTAALARALEAALVVLVAPSGLGTISSVRLCAAALGDTRLVVVLNRFDPRHDLHRRNRAWLADREGLEVLVSPAELAERIACLAGEEAGGVRPLR